MSGGDDAVTDTFYASNGKQCQFKLIDGDMFIKNTGFGCPSTLTRDLWENVWTCSHVTSPFNYYVIASLFLFSLVQVTHTLLLTPHFSRCSFYFVYSLLTSFVVYLLVYFLFILSFLIDCCLGARSSILSHPTSQQNTLRKLHFLCKLFKNSHTQTAKLILLHLYIVTLSFLKNQ